MTVGNMESAELFDGGIKGRGLRATKEISTGEVVFAEPSFSAVVFDRYETNVWNRTRETRTWRFSDLKYRLNFSTSVFSHHVHDEDT